jgi:hypothetical protein
VDLGKDLKNIERNKIFRLAKNLRMEEPFTNYLRRVDTSR